MEEKNKNNKKSQAIALAIAALIIIVAAAAATYAWAKYASNVPGGNATAQIAKFHFELKNLNNESSATVQSGIVNFPVTRTDANNRVANNLIAPNTYGRIEMIIDTTDTEVSYKYDLNIRIENCPTNLKFYSDSSYTQEIASTRTSQTINGVSTKVATIQITKFVPVAQANAQHTENVYWKWEYETGNDTNQVNSNDIIDTADMEKNVTMQITATGTQMNTNLTP